MCKKAGSPPTGSIYGKLYLGLGRLEFNRNSYDKSLQFLNKAEKILSVDQRVYSSELTMIYSYLGRAFSEITNYSQSISNHKKSIELQNKFNIPKNPKLSASYFSLAESYYQFKEYSKALIYYQKSLVEIDHSTVNDSLYFNNLALTPKLGLIQSEPMVIKALNGKAKTPKILYQETNKTELLIAAHTSYNKALEIIHSLLYKYKSDGSKLNLLQQTNGIYEENLNVVYQLYKLTGTNKFLDACYSIIQKSKSNVLSQNINTKNFIESDLPDEQRTKERILKEDIVYYETEIEKLKATDYDQNKLNTLENKLFYAKKAYEIF